MVVSSLAHLTFVSAAALFRWCSARAAKDNSGKAVSCAELSYFLFCTTVSKRHLLSLTHGLNKMHTRACRAINKHLSLEHKCVSVSVGSKIWSDIPTSYHTAFAWQCFTWWSSGEKPKHCAWRNSCTSELFWQKCAGARWFRPKTDTVCLTVCCDDVTLLANRYRVHKCKQKYQLRPKYFECWVQLQLPHPDLITARPLQSRNRSSRTCLTKWLG